MTFYLPKVMSTLLRSLSTEFLLQSFLTEFLMRFHFLIELRCSVVQHRSRSNNYEIVFLFRFGHFKFHFSKRFQVFIVC